MNTAKPAAPAPKHAKTQTAVTIGIGQLRVGDHIVTKVSTGGVVLKSYKVTNIEGCHGSPEKIHVNRSDCYDTRFASVQVAR